MSKGKTILLTVITGLLLACNSDHFKTHSTGLEYQFIVENKTNAKPKIGDILVLKMKYCDNNNNIIEESARFKIRHKESTHKGGSIEDALSLMHKGDSAIFRINTSDFYTFSRNQEVPKSLAESTKLTFYLKVVDIIDEQEYNKDQKLARISNKRTEEAQLNNFLVQNNITTEPSMSGLYIIELQAGKGEHPTPGKKVSVHYIGSFLNGEVFDSSYKRNEPFDFYLGIGKVIMGWDEGVAKMKVGGKYKLIIPSYLAYGEQQVGPIPPNSTLVFDIELLDFEK